jgi:hypothetical protein
MMMKSAAALHKSDRDPGVEELRGSVGSGFFSRINILTQKFEWRALPATSDQDNVR